MPRTDLPPALPPETRPVGQLIAESIRFYGRRFWLTLPLGLPVAVTNQLSAGRSYWVQVAALAAATPFLTAAYVRACQLVLGEDGDRRSVATAFGAGILVVAPVPLLVLVYVLPAVAWLAFVGLVVPVALAERLPFRAAVRRATKLARADYVHAAGSLAAITLVFGVTKVMLIFLLRGSADTGERIALFLADLVLSPLLFIVPALLYLDQVARAVQSPPRPRRRRDADLHPALEPDGAGRADAEGKP